MRDSMQHLSLSLGHLAYQDSLCFPPSYLVNFLLPIFLRITSTCYSLGVCPFHDISVGNKGISFMRFNLLFASLFLLWIKV